MGRLFSAREEMATRRIYVRVQYILCAIYTLTPNVPSAFYCIYCMFIEPYSAAYIRYEISGNNLTDR